MAFPTLISRPTSYTGLWSWIGTVDHKRIGTLYGITAFLYFLVGGIEALVIRAQLAQAESDLVSPEVFNQLFTMHGTTMVFLVVMPMSAAFFNWMVPLLIGARDVAFPRLNAFSYWTFLAGSIFLNLSFFLGGAPNAGWFGYANLTGSTYSPGDGVTFWALGLSILGVASLAASFNFVVTILNMRAPGMGLMKMPVFVWMALVTNILLALAMPVIAVALVQLSLDRVWDTNFFNPAAGGDPVLWQHLFWLFGHPEVYILILPAMGIVSEVLPVFSRKPLFGYPAVVFAGAVIGFMGWFVWSHHMFTVGLGPATNSAFAISTMLIAVPTGVKIFNWIGTTWGGKLNLNTSMLFSLGFIGMFIIGGLSGVSHASPPTDAQQQDTYYIVAHFHYVLFGGAILGLFSGGYYWWPKMTGKRLGEGLGKLHFWLMLIGFNLTFGPMHWLGLNGMPRRIATYADGLGWEMSNAIASAGALLLAISVLIFIINVIRTISSTQEAEDDPWDARTLEWSIPSPPPAYNFARIPQVKSLDDFWYTKHPELLHDEQGVDAEVHEPVEEDTHGGGSIHLPSMSYYPFVLSIGMVIAIAGFMQINVELPGTNIQFPWLSAIGIVIGMWGLMGWSMEPVTEEGGH
ncbi:MAG: cytochrome c oxidase subunit I [Chloroflexi bacterium]|nr:cytochrome c oxidase subunit I [Chloroflexota bacterium]MBT4072515.1 cytochrome c oxidase subunit I [Chloroflexota bacterium]MBT4515600.1 cytochrome c oxidase subunit I [Chloroflexota bacterium]MBT5318629.1 cytochrome c oxidase subunit I [Chloroflexota bacterium]MBT6680600.1 cytochrome c oxidase subunit I [Chloroflexota bacterium]